MIKILLTTAATGALVLTAAAANPQEKSTAAPKYQPNKAEEPMSPVAVTTRQDAAKLADWQFAAADTNADGSIDAAEFAAFVAANVKEGAGVPSVVSEAAEPADKAFEAIAKGDEKISREELVAARAESFDKADADGNKRLDALEQQRFAALVTAKPQTGVTSH